MLQDYVNENVARIEEEYKLLNKIVPEIIDTEGVDYLHLDFMKSWAFKKGVSTTVE